MRKLFLNTMEMLAFLSQGVKMCFWADMPRDRYMRASIPRTVLCCVGDCVVKSGRKRQQETDSCINSREDTVVSVTLSPSLSVAVPSFFLSLSFRSSPSFLLFPSFLPSLSLRCNTFVGQMHSEQKKSPLQPLPCVFVLL